MIGMNISISLQAVRFLLSCGFGIVLGLFYDFFRVIRLSFCNNSIVTFIADIIYSFFALTFFALFILVVCQGDIRFFLLIGSFFGIIFYVQFASRIVVHAGCKIADHVKTLLCTILFPFLWIRNKYCLYRQKRRLKHGIYKQKEKSG